MNAQLRHRPVYDLRDRNVAVFGAAGSVGTAVVRAFAAAGATVHASGRSKDGLDHLVSGLPDTTLRTSVLDVLEHDAVARYVENLVDEAGSIDVVFNAFTYQDIQGVSLAEVDQAALLDRLSRAVRGHHNVVSAAAGPMMRQGQGLISTMVGYGRPWPGLCTSSVSWQLVEAMMRQFAADLGGGGIRVAWLRTGGFKESVEANPDYGSSYTGDQPIDETLEALREDTLLKRVASVEEAGRAAVYLALSPGVTGCAINLTAGAVTD